LGRLPADLDGACDRRAERCCHFRPSHLRWRGVGCAWLACRRHARQEIAADAVAALRCLAWRRGRRAGASGRMLCLARRWCRGLCRCWLCGCGFGRCRFGRCRFGRCWARRRWLGRCRLGRRRLCRRRLGPWRRTRHGLGRRLRPGCRLRRHRLWWRRFWGRRLRRRGLRLLHRHGRRGFRLCRGLLLAQFGRHVGRGLGVGIGRCRSVGHLVGDRHHHPLGWRFDFLARRRKRERGYQSGVGGQGQAQRHGFFPAETGWRGIKGIARRHGDQGWLSAAGTAPASPLPAVPLLTSEICLNPAAFNSPITAMTRP